VILASSLKSFAFSEGKKRSGKVALSAGMLERPMRANGPTDTQQSTAKDMTINDVPDLWVTQQISIAREQIEELLILIDNDVVEAADLGGHSLIIYQALRDVMQPRK
jgi:hypothetical protein